MLKQNPFGFCVSGARTVSRYSCHKQCAVAVNCGWQQEGRGTRLVAPEHRAVTYLKSNHVARVARDVHGAVISQRRPIGTFTFRNGVHPKHRAIEGAEANGACVIESEHQKALKIAGNLAKTVCKGATAYSTSMYAIATRALHLVSRQFWLICLLLRIRYHP